MEAKMIVRMEGEERVKIQIRFSGTGWDHKELVDREAEKYAAAKEIGFTYEQGEYQAETDATPEACAPFVAFAETHNLEIVQL